MSIASEIQRIKNNIAAAYDACGEKGATLPQTQNSAHLADTIESITGGGEYSQAELRKERVRAMLPAGYSDHSKENYSLLVNHLADYFVDQKNVDLQTADFVTSIGDGQDPAGVAIVKMQGAGTIVHMLDSEGDYLLGASSGGATFYAPDTGSEAVTGSLIACRVSKITDTTVTLGVAIYPYNITSTTEMSVDLVAAFNALPSGGMTAEYSFTADFMANGTSIMQVPCSIVLGKF